MRGLDEIKYVIPEVQYGLQTLVQLNVLNNVHPRFIEFRDSLKFITGFGNVFLLKYNETVAALPRLQTPLSLSIYIYIYIYFVL